MGMVASVDQLKYLIHTPFALCHGVFDVLHEGHLAYFEEAKKLSDTLVVSITPDRYVNKGPGRPYFNEAIRARMVAALEMVDFVVINDQPRATNVIHVLKPKFYVKGPDYKDRSKDVTGGILEEESAIQTVGGQIVFTDRPTRSSSTLINKFFHQYSDEQKEAIDKIKSLGGMDAIEKVFKDISKLRVFVLGEPIVDTYVFCAPEGVSSKSPTISARFMSEENYAGGSLAIANHLSDFVSQVHLYAPHGREVYFQNLKKEQVDRRVIYHDSLIPHYVTPRKTRYIEADKNQRIFELTNIKESISGCKNLHKLTEDLDIVLLCDFGHGLFENGFNESTSSLKPFVALNCQTNSSNFGFNPFTKHKNYEYLSLDLKEARIAFHDRYSDNMSLFRKITSPNVSMTLGSNGALYKDGDDVIKTPAFSDKVVDAIGAGDAYYAITALMVRAGAPKEMVPFVGNVFAGLKTKIIGNKFSVTKAELLKALTAILK